MRGATASELDRHPGREEAVRAKLGVVVADERIVGIVGGRPRREAWPELPNDADPVIA